VTRTPKHGETFKIGSIAVTALHTPCHTQDSICFFMQDGGDKVVFTGDTLFHGGRFPSARSGVAFLMGGQAAAGSLRATARRCTRR
jgi:glyoxylase-like metal-dependent hydrolase (beta-lactamase superfamily II)